MKDLSKIIRQREIKAQFMKGDKQAEEFEFIAELSAALQECQDEIKMAKAEAQMWKVNNFAMRMYGRELEGVITRFIKGVFNKHDLLKYWHKLEKDFNAVKQNPETLGQ